MRCPIPSPEDFSHIFPNIGNEDDQTQKNGVLNCSHGISFKWIWTKNLCQLCEVGDEYPHVAGFHGSLLHEDSCSIAT